jgi:phenylpropionate dioxygenase-like ring-hydroxylating dioxygenase large terminal subunit
MVMSAALIESVKRRSLEEADRTAYPAGFPVLPGVPAARYADAGFARLEHDAVFGRSWLFVAHADQVRRAGDYLLLEQLPQPIVLVRGDDRRIRAFHNTCKHRGAALVQDQEGNSGRRLTCPYHAWTYSLSGELVGVPEAHNFSDLDRECHALSEIRCEQWGPLVFVNLDRSTRPLAKFLGNVADDLSELADLDGTLRLAGRTVRDVPVNWKVPVDANIETYHVNFVHRDTAGRALRQAATGIQLLPNGHSRMLVRMFDGLEFDSPFPPFMDGVGDLPRSGTFSYHVFPNLSIVFGGAGFVFFITNWPTGPSASSYHVHWCSSLDPEVEENRAALDAYIEFNRTVLFEDLTVLPGVQASINAGTLDVVRLSYQERRIYYVHETIDRVIGGESVPEPLRVPHVLGPYVED